MMYAVKAETLRDIATEVERQERLKAAGKFPRTIAEMSDDDALIVVVEELGEVAEDIQSGKREHARVELIEAITCMIRWYEQDWGDPLPSYFSGLAAEDVRNRIIAAGRRARKAQSVEPSSSRIA
jgi:hypothetical protein